jgi:erythronate-4-phosphate dehydrogenase
LAPPNRERTARLPAIDRLKIIIDQNIRGAESTFGVHGQLVAMDGRQINAKVLDGADALIVRTATQVDEKLLKNSAVGFVGTTSIGKDHLDTQWLDQQDICWANAPGCNADSAAQYTLAMIWLACHRRALNLDELRVGIIGRGNVGSRLEGLLKALNVHTVANDPPLAEQGQKGLVSLDEALAQDIVSLHVPLIHTGEHATHRMLGPEQLALIPNGGLLVNAARGDVVNAQALENELRDGRIKAALDVWPGEPFFSSEILSRTTVATPHIAGYSLDGRRNGTHMVYQAFCKWAGLKPASPSEPGDDPVMPNPPGSPDRLSSILEQTCFVARHDAEMRKLEKLSSGQRAKEFDRLRREYPIRRDFQSWTVHCQDPRDVGLLRQLGFTVKQTD